MTLARLAAAVSLASLLGCRLSESETPKAGTPPRLEQLCGHWRTGVEQGFAVEERWQIVAGGLAGESVIIDLEGIERRTERFAIDVHEQGSTYRARPSGATSETPFEQVEARVSAAGGFEWAWANPEHDSPQRIEYELVDANRLRARIIGPPKRSLEWSFERVAPCPTSG